MQEVLAQTRLALREEKVNLKGKYPIDQVRADSLRKNILEIRNRIDAVEPLGALAELNLQEKKKFESAFWENFDNSVRSADKAFSRGVKKDEIDGQWKGEKLDFFEEKNVEMLLQEYNEVVQVVLGWQRRVTKNTFLKAAEIFPYWNASELQNNFANETIAKELKKVGIEMDLKEIQEVFTKSKRLYFAVSNLKDPIDAMKRGGENLKYKLTDEKIDETLKKAGVDMEIDEIQEVFTNGRRLNFAMNNIADPLDGVKRVGENFKNKLTDENIQKILKEAKIEMSIEKIQKVFTKGARLHFAVYNIKNSLGAVKRAGENLKHKLTDKNILAKLKEAGVDMDIDEGCEAFTESKKMYFAISNPKNSLNAIKRVGENLKNKLTDEKIQEALKEVEIEMDLNEVHEVFIKSSKLHVAINNIINPLGAIKEIGKNLKNKLTDAKIQEALREVEIEMDLNEILEVFTKGRRLHFAIHNRKNPLGAVKRSGENLKNELTDEKIQEALMEVEIEMKIEEIQEVFTKGIRGHFAIHNRKNPLGAVKRSGGNLKNELTDEKIQEALKEVEIEMDLNEIRKLFTKGLKMYFAVYNIKNPLKAVKRAGGNLKNELTDEKIQEALKEVEVEMGIEEIQKNFTESKRLYFAIHNRKNPLDAMKRVGENLKYKLIDEKIQEALKEAEIDMSIKKIQQVFTEGKRLYFAAKNITEPLVACVKYIKGEILYNGKFQG
jgi:hypothetical protein